MRIQHIQEFLRERGAKTCHEQRVLRAWLQAKPLDSGARRRLSEDFFPLGIRAGLPQLAARLEALAHVRSEHPSDDGSLRMLVGLADGQTIESVLLPRDGLCVSTQVGCAVGCSFCMTGREGLLRQLDSTEIVAQVVLARQRRSVKKVVFMGMGESSHNLRNVLEAIELLGTAGAIGHKNLVFSTVGDRRVFERLSQGVVKPALAVSLHTTRADLREKLLPNAPRIDPAELIALAEGYARTVAYPVQYQWTLLAGVNDSGEELENIVRLLRGKYAMLNVIPYNAIADLPFSRPAGEKTAEMVRWLNRHGILTRIRNSAGQDVDGGCGQLRARAAAGSPLLVRVQPV